MQALREVVPESDQKDSLVAVRLGPSLEGVKAVRVGSRERHSLPQEGNMQQFNA